MKRFNRLLAVLPIVISLSACNDVKESGFGGQENEYEPEGVYSDAGHGDKNERHDGPLTEWYDHTLGVEQKNIRKAKYEYLHQEEHGNPRNPTVPLTTEDRGLLRDNRHETRHDRNYHGNVGLEVRKTKSSYYTNYDGHLVEKVSNAANAIKNVRDVRSFIYEKEAMIALQLDDNTKKVQTVDQVRRAVAPYLDGYTVKVSTSTSSFSQLRNLDNDLRDGGPIEIPGARYNH